MDKTKLILALKGENRGRPPVWLMRQAGRFLPEYQKLSKRYSLSELFFTPELAARVTLMPLLRFQMDAAILFSDISVVARGLGLKLTFQKGPRIDPPVTPGILEGLAFAPERLEPIFQAIRLLKPMLKVPLIGFCGGPFTVASYLIGSLEETKKWMVRDPQSFHRLLEKIEQISALYLALQVESGADVVQLFDSWASVLAKRHFLEFSFPYLERLVRALAVPSIVFMRGGAYHLAELSTLPSALSLDWQTHLHEVRQKSRQPLQGNLDPDLLFAPLPLIQQETRYLLESMQCDPAFIVNLGHGVKPGTPLDAVQVLVDTVKAFDG